MTENEMKTVAQLCEEVELVLRYRDIAGCGWLVSDPLGRADRLLAALKAVRILMWDQKLRD